MGSLSESDFGRIAGWESADGTYHEVEDQYGDTIGREPSDYSLEHADRVVITYENIHGEQIWISVEALTDDYGIEDAIAEVEDVYE